jgi:hypothetical protein
MIQFADARSIVSHAKPINERSRQVCDQERAFEREQKARIRIPISGKLDNIQGNSY